VSRYKHFPGLFWKKEKKKCRFPEWCPPSYTRFVGGDNKKWLLAGKEN
jgi:hypothetical protein